MNTVNATYAKQNFGACVADATRQPLVIEKSGRPTVVMLSYDEFQRLSEAEDAMWLRKAEEASAEGYLTSDETEAFLKKRIASAIENGRK